MNTFVNRKASISWLLWDMEYGIPWKFFVIILKMEAYRETCIADLGEHRFPFELFDAVSFVAMFPLIKLPKSIRTYINMYAFKSPVLKSHISSI